MTIEPSDDQFRAALRDVLAETRLSMRALSAALGRDPGYVATLLDPTRPSRARPTPADLVRLADASGLSLAGLFERLWGVPEGRLADGADDSAGAGLTAAERATLRDFVAFLVARHRRSRGS